MHLAPPSGVRKNLKASRKARVASTSRPLVGSSSTMLAGSCTRARASAVFMRSPWLKPSVRRSSRFFMSSMSASTSARTWAASVVMPCNWPKYTMFSRALRRGYRPRASLSTPMRATAAWGARATSRPSTVMRPALGAINPANMRSVVVLPAPLGPSRPVMWPLGALRLTSRTACTHSKGARLNRNDRQALLAGAATGKRRARCSISIMGHPRVYRLRLHRHKGRWAGHGTGAGGVQCQCLDIIRRVNEPKDQVPQAA